MLLFLSSSLRAEDKGEYFQKWDKEAQIGFLSTSVVMAITIASQSDRELMRCIDEWYGKDETKKTRQNEVLKTIAENQKHLPNVVLLAIIQKACGKFPAR